MNDSKMSRESRDEALERILAETAKNPYEQRRAVRPSTRSTTNSLERNRSVNTHEKRANLKSTNENVFQTLTESQKAEEAKARAAKKIEDIKNAKKIQKKTIQPNEKLAEVNMLPDNKDEFFKLENYTEKKDFETSVFQLSNTKKAENELILDQEYNEVERKTEAETMTLNDFLDIFESVLTVILVVMMIFTYIIRVAVVDGESMSPTLESSDKLIVRSIAYKPDNGDVVVINNEGAHLISESKKVVETDGLEKSIVKRIIAVGGQTVDIDFEKGVVTVDGKQLDETYISEPTTRDEFAFTYPLTVPEGYIFAMGDNRNLSKDSRHPEIGLIPEDNVVGKVVFRIFPFDKFGGID